MAITDIDISETLETNAPSIKYRGNEGPKSPQEEQMMMEQQQMAAIDPMMQKKLKLIEELMSQGYDFGAASNLADKILSGQDEQDIGMAYGGIAGLDGRRRYGWGSKIKKRIRKLIPNEVAQVAEVAAPFVAPFNPAIAGLMSGIGGFDRHGSIGKGLKSGLINYGVGQVARGIGGAGPQWGLKAPGTGSGIGSYFTSPTSGAQLFGAKAPTDMSKFNELGLGGSNPAGIAGNTGNISLAGDSGAAMEAFYKGVTPQAADVINQTQTGGIWNTIKKYALDPKILTGLAIGGIGAAGLMGNMKADEIQDLQRGEGLDIEGIRAEVIEAFKDESGEKLAGLRSKYPFLGKRDTKDTAAMAYGGRIGRAEGGIMDLGGMEKDYRNTGGFVDLGAKEKADDVPARLSVNEFVMTADAVRGAGGGDIDKGAEIMERVMENLEKGGRISEESQGLKGAQEMFEVSERLSEVV